MRFKKLRNSTGPLLVGHLGEHLARRHIERGVGVGGSVAHVRVGASGWGAGQHRQDRRRPSQGLDLGLLVDA